MNKVLAMYVDLECTQRKYEKLRKHNERIGNDKLYPPYLYVSTAKTMCYPDHIYVSESASVISLLDHTTKRILLLDENK